MTFISGEKVSHGFGGNLHADLGGPTGGALPSVAPSSQDGLLQFPVTLLASNPIPWYPTTCLRINLIVSVTDCGFLLTQCNEIKYCPDVYTLKGLPKWFSGKKSACPMQEVQV